jgi:hypothetical protein
MLSKTFVLKDSGRGTEIVEGVGNSGMGNILCGLNTT